MHLMSIKKEKKMNFEISDVDRVMQMQSGLKEIDLRNTFTNPLGDLIYKANKALEDVKEELLRMERSEK